MYVDSLVQITKLMQRAGTAVVAVSPEVQVRTERGKKKSIKTAEAIELPGAVVIEPQDGKKITVEQVREVIAMTQNLQTEDRFFVFRQAELLGEEAENAMLKLLEEPKENYHFILLTREPNALLPTILSRAEVYYVREENTVTQPPAAKPKVLEMAKRLLAIGAAREYLTFADEIHKNKDERSYALEILATAIELSYKSYLMTNKRRFLDKTPRMIVAYDNIKNNGNVRLHLVADLC